MQEKMAHHLEPIEQVGYLSFMRSFRSPSAMAYVSLTQAVEGCQDDQLKEAVRFLLCGCWIDPGSFECLFPSATLRQMLTRSGVVVEADGRFGMPNFQMLANPDIAFFVGRANFAGVYYGEDSEALVRYVNVPRNGSALELCAGSGFASLSAAVKQCFIHSVDINPYAASIREINAKINGVGDRLSSFCESAESALKRFAVEGLKFDTVMFNPPLLPIPEDVRYPFVGGGGPEGIRFLEIHLELIANVLDHKGTVQFIGTGLASESHLYFLDKIRSLANNIEGVCDVQVTGAWEYANSPEIFSSLAHSAVDGDYSRNQELERERLESLYRANGADRLVFYFAKIHRSPREGRVVRNDLRFRGHWFTDGGNRIAARSTEFGM